MTETLSALVPGFTAPNGQPIYIERVRQQHRANLGSCATCGYLMADGGTFTLEESIRLHRVQTDHKKVRLWRYL